MPDDKREPTVADLAAIAGMLGDIEQIEAKPIEWGGGERGPVGSSEVPSAVYAPAAERLLRAIHQHGLIVHYDWPSWEDEARRFLDPELVNTASLDEIRRLLTLHVRKERFSEGHFAEMISTGHISALLRRLGALVRELPGDEIRPKRG